MNVLSRVSIALVGLAVAGGLGSVMALDEAGFNQRKGVVLEQPVPFSHKHHVQDIGVDCRYCHTAVEKSAQAGIPPTQTCMNCHKQIWSDSPILETVRESYRTGEPLRWNKIHDLPDFAYFNHSIHVAKGVGCFSCHGRIDQMPMARSAHATQMQWCLACHRNPQDNLRPKDQITNMTWTAEDQTKLGAELLKTYKVRGAAILTSCSTCHR
jgi:hypothetical protein